MLASTGLDSKLLLNNAQEVKRHRIKKHTQTNTISIRTCTEPLASLFFFSFWFWVMSHKQELWDNNNFKLETKMYQSEKRMKS